MTIKQTVESQSVRNARKVAHDAEVAARKAAKEKHRRDHPDASPVTWGDLRRLGLVDD